MLFVGLLVDSVLESVSEEMLLCEINSALLIENSERTNVVVMPLFRMRKVFMLLYRILWLIKELTDLYIIFFLNYRDDLLEGRSVTRIFFIYVTSQVFAHCTLDVHILQILDVSHILTGFWIFTLIMSALDFAWIINALILTNIF